MLAPEVIAGIAEELAEADRAHTVIPRITARHPDATVEDSYAIQGVWRDRMIASGRTLVGRKIGLTSKAMQQALGLGRGGRRGGGLGVVVAIGAVVGVDGVVEVEGEDRAGGEHQRQGENGQTHGRTPAACVKGQRITRQR